MWYTRIMDTSNLPKLDRLVRFDERSRNYRAVEGIEDRPLRSRQWTCDIHNDQGAEGACVGFAWSHEIAAKPKPIPTDNEWAKRIYRRAQQLDPWPGENYSGTSVLAGVQAVQEVLNSRGKPLIKEYRWAFGTEDVIRTLGYKGPVVLGIEWHKNFYYPREDGWIALGGGVVGGHAILAKGVHVELINPDAKATYSNIDPHKSYVILHNSWGTNYGDGGDAYISVYDLNYLLGRDGEACIPVRRSFE